MARKVTAAGGFYSFISHGLGRELGMAAGLSMVVAYSVFEASLCGGFAYFACAKLAQYGYTVSWYWPALFMVALIGVLAFFDVKISARVLGVALIGEVLVLAIFDILVFGQGGENIQAAALNPINAFKNLPSGSLDGTDIAAGGVGGRRVLRVLVVGRLRDGAELRRGVREPEEDRSPGHVPLGRRAGHLLRDHLVGGAVRLRLDRGRRVQAQNNAYGFFLDPAQQFGNEFLRSAMSYLIITGAFACGMAFHNTTARYFYSLGREKVLPSALGRTHVRYRSPHIASTTQSVICALIVVAFAVFADGAGDDTTTIAYVQLYGLMAFMGVVLILFIQALVSVAIWNYFRTHHPGEHQLVEPHHRPGDLGDRPAGRAGGGDRQDRLPRCGVHLRVVPGGDRRDRLRRRCRLRDVPEIE